MIVVFGANGMLGTTVVEYFQFRKYHVRPLTRKDCNLNTPTFDTLKELVKDAKVVINCSGCIPQRETNDNIFQVNSFFPQILGRLCKLLNIHFIHITTDCVFSGTKGKYLETDPHDAISAYGISKSMGEYPLATIIRTSIIGEEKINKKSLLEWAINHDSYSSIKGYVNHYWNGVTCLQLAKIIENIIASQSYWRGIKHIHSGKTISKYDLLRLISKVYNKNLHVICCETEKCDRSLASEDYVFDIPDLETQLYEQKMFWMERNVS